MRCLRWLLVLLVCWHLVTPLQAQRTAALPLPANYVVRNIDNSNGLSSNDVLSLGQDKKGYIWIGTTKGLQRYDGLRFVNCLSAGSIRGELVASSMYSDDSHGRILYNQSGTSLFQWSFISNSATSLSAENELQPGPGEKYNDEKGVGWMLREYHIDNIAGHPGKKQGIALLKKDGNTRARWAHFIEDWQNRQTWIIDSVLGLLLFDGNSKKIFSTHYNPANHPLFAGLQLPSEGIHIISADSRGNIWLISWSRLLYRYNIAAGKLFTYSIVDILKDEGFESTLPCWISGMLEDNHGVLWLATAKAGLLQYDFETDGFKYITRQPGNNLALQYNHQINTIFQDREENIWLGTDRGISIFNPYRQYFSRVGNDEAAARLTAETEVSAAYATQNQDLWIGNWGGGIRVYDSAHHLKKHFFFSGQYEKNQIWSFLQQGDGVVWAGCQHGYLHYIDTVSWSITTMHPPELGNSTVKCMIKDGKGNTLLGLYNGKIAVWDHRSRRFMAYDDHAQPVLAPLAPIETMFVDENDICWAATTDGLREFDIQKRCFIAIHRPSLKDAMHCFGIAPYNDSVFVVSTEYNGLYYFNRHTKTFSKIPVNQEHPYWSAYAVTKDMNGSLWFTTDHDICNYDPANGKFFACHPENGFIDAGFVAANFLVRPKGKWMTWTDMEVVGFDPNEIRTAQNRPASITITGFKVFSTSLFIDSMLNKGQPVPLSYKDNFIGIEFSDLQYSGIKQTKYYYRLDGIDKDWVYGGTSGYAGYTNLSPGRYIFRVRAENTDSDNGIASMVITIAAPFWATAWFRTICVVVAALLIFFLVRIYNRGLRKEADMRQQIAATEMMALRAQMNPHFIFNCINSIDALIQCDDKYHATVYLNKFARLIRNILDSSKQHTIALSRDLETLRLYIELEQFRSDHKFTAEINVDGSILQEDYKVPPLIIQPYVENAIIHGLRNRQDFNGKLTIGISRKNGRLVYLIEDNGIGRAAASHRSQHDSYGMQMSRDRVNLFNGEEDIPVIITDLEQYNQPAGTRIEVSLKIIS